MKTLGARLGCASALAIAIVAGAPLLFPLGWAGAHCEPVPQCQRAIELHFGALFAGILAVAAATALLLSQIINRLAARREDEGTSPTFVIGALVAVVVTTVAVVWALFSFAMDLVGG